MVEKAKLHVVKNHWTQVGEDNERTRIINLLLDQNIIRRCAATDKLVAFNTHGTEVVYIKDLETK
jgi:hypothetical protein